MQNTFTTDKATRPSLALLPKVSSTAADLLEAFCPSFNVCRLVHILTTHHLASCHVTSCHVTSHHVMACHMMSCHMLSHNTAGSVCSHKVDACMLMTLKLVQTGYVHVLWVAMVWESQGTSHQLLWQLLRMIHQWCMS